MPKPSANTVIEKGAKVADDVRVGPFSYVGPNVEIASGCVIENNVTLIGATRLGRNTHVFPLAVIGACEETGREGRCTLGSDNAVREHVTIYAGRRQPTVIGSDNLLMIGSQVGAGATIGDHGIFANFTQIGAGARIEDYFHTSGFTFIEPGVSVGAYTFTAGYADIDADAPPYAILQGCPFRVRGVNTIKLKRCGFADEDIRALKDAFRELFNGQDRHADAGAVERLAGRAQLNGHVRALLDAIQRFRPAGDRP
jgi:UDP-N-acetylglucosamine acyltransferase